ncbi:MAG: hypothetical protein JSV63_04390 [Candidatus Aenigmatarchaeota archaeon]|nr:MAG: hypothetical protein JSV63_04390 [Candidatus Aenigmarchaeota archaeon]
MKGQVEIMEYMVFVLLTMFIIAFVLFMIFGFQFLSLGGEQAGEIESRSLFILQSLLSSKTLNSPQYQKGSVLDDAVLTVMTCDDIVDMFGERVYVEVRTFLEKPDCDDPGLSSLERSRCESRIGKLISMENIQCTSEKYPECFVWRYQGCEKQDEMVFRSVPVNVLRKMNSTVAMGVITIGIRGSET